MNTDLLTVAPEFSLREAAKRMSERNAGAALVVDPTTGSPREILTERDVLNAVASGQDPDTERVAENTTAEVVTVHLDASLEEAVQKMTAGISDICWWSTEMKPWASSRCEISCAP